MHHLYPTSLIDKAKKVNHDLKKLSQCSKANKLSLNIGKTKLIIFRLFSKKINDSVRVGIKKDILFCDR